MGDGVEGFSAAGVQGEKGRLLIGELCTNQKKKRTACEAQEDIKGNETSATIRFAL